LIYCIEAVIETDEDVDAPIVSIGGDVADDGDIDDVDCTLCEDGIVDGVFDGVDVDNELLESDVESVEIVWRDISDDMVILDDDSICDSSEDKDVSEGEVLLGDSDGGTVSASVV